MSKEGNFLIYCTEQYKSAKGLTGRQLWCNCQKSNNVKSTLPDRMPYYKKEYMILYDSGNPSQ